MPRICPAALALVLGLLLSTPAAGQKYGEVEKVAPTAEAPRGQTLEWTSAEGKGYWYRLPGKIDPRKPPNLVFMLHGTGLTWGWAFWNYPIGNGRFRGNDIVIAPEGMTPGQGDTFNFIQGKKDGDQIAGLIKQFRSRFPINKVYVYGHSQGAFFCYWFAGAYTELVDGIVAHAGNVLDVSHNALAKKKVAIGILHGKADAVVPVDCAYRTEKIYRQQGYEKIKLEIVEGLTEQSGHWPLPKQVAEMFDWLDQVNADSPSLAIRVALAELAKKEPDLQVIADGAGKADRLLKRYKADDRDDLKAKLEAIQAFLTGVEAEHARTILDGGGADKKSKDTTLQPWMVHFRLVNAVLTGSKSWRKAVKTVISRARKQDRMVSAALKQLDSKPGRASLRQAINVFEKAPLAQDTVGLEKTLLRLEEKPPKGVSPADFTHFRELVGSREAAEKEGTRSATSITSEAAKKFREEHSAFFGGKKE